jgi:hypothetical protein
MTRTFLLNGYKCLTCAECHTVHVAGKQPADKVQSILGMALAILSLVCWGALEEYRTVLPY